MSKQIALRARRVRLAVPSATRASRWFDGERSFLPPTQSHFPQLPFLWAVFHRSGFAEEGVPRPQQENGSNHGRAVTIGLKIMMLIAITFSSPPIRSEDAGADNKKACAFDEEREGNICYPRCKSNYVGDADECVEVCPSNSQDYGNKCLMGPAAVLKKYYSRGAGRRID